jgi:hypothetical protein
LDGRLVEEVRTAGGHNTKNEAIAAALTEYVRRRQMRISELFGKIEYQPAHYYKAERGRKRSSKFSVYRFR